MKKYPKLDKDEFKKLIESTLKEYDLYSESAVKLLMGTCAQESLFGQYRKQITGPAISVFQIEPATFDWLRDKYKKRFPKISNIQFKDLEFDDKAAIIFCRLRYLADPHPLPNADNIRGLAGVWKRVYNTFLGKGTVEEFLSNYERFCV